MSAMGVYLKYFHGGGKSIEELLGEVDQVNKESENGNVDESQIDNLHLDEKEEGGIEKTLAVGFTTKSYKTAKKGKSKGKLYEISVFIHQSKYSSTGNAWKVWDSSTVLARWCYQHREQWNGKRVHEVGSGCGLVGILVSYFSQQVTMSDYKLQILDNITKNVNLNERAKESGKIGVQLLDFEEIYEGKREIKEEEKVDIVLGSDVIYGLHLSTWLPSTINQLLNPEGICYLVNPKNRVGVDQFVENMEALGFHCSVQTVSENLCNDFVKKSCWDIISCSRLALSSFSSSQNEKQNSKEKEEDDQFLDLENSFFHHKELKKTLPSTVE